ncbi:MAG: hypothetical protein H5U40_08425, partial [Polyangiaceae bacterium]|nr:hypothetical protein [Polyangiaceae bacterium]
MKADRAVRRSDPVASVREAWLSRRSFREKLYSLPIIAVAGLVTVGAVMAFFSDENRTHLVEIEQQYLPTLETSRTLEELLSTIQRRLQDASAASDPEGLREADALKNEFFSELSRLGRSRVRSAEEVRALRESFREYYD